MKEGHPDKNLRDDSLLVLLRFVHESYKGAVIVREGVFNFQHFHCFNVFARFLTCFSYFMLLKVFVVLICLKFLNVFFARF